MSKEFVRTIKNTTTDEPLSTNMQNDLLSDTDNIYIRNKNNYFPLTKSILNIEATDTIISVALLIDGINNKATITTKENKLKEYIEQHIPKNENQIKILQWDGNYQEIFNEIEANTNTFYILEYQNNKYYPITKDTGLYSFASIFQDDDGFLNYCVLDLTIRSASLTRTVISPSEVITIWQ